MTARERVEYLLDEGSFQELDPAGPPTVAGLEATTGPNNDRPSITGFRPIDGRKVLSVQARTSPCSAAAWAR